MEGGTELNLPRSHTEAVLTTPILHVTRPTTRTTHNAQQASSYQSGIATAQHIIATWTPHSTQPQAGAGGACINRCSVHKWHLASHIYHIHSISFSYKKITTLQKLHRLQRTTAPKALAPFSASVLARGVFTRIAQHRPHPSSWVPYGRRSSSSSSPAATRGLCAAGAVYASVPEVVVFRCTMGVLCQGRQEGRCGARAADGFRLP